MGIYIYGIAFCEGPATWRLPAGVNTITVDGFTALVRPLEGEVPFAVTTDASDERVLEQAMAVATVVPLGRSATDQRQVRRLLSRKRPELINAVERLAGKFECAIRVYRRRGDVFGKKTRSLERLKDGLFAEIARGIKPLYVEVRPASMIGEKMLLNLALLVDRDCEPALAEKVAGQVRHCAVEFEVRYISGLPPYNFTDIRFLPGMWSGNWRRPAVFDTINTGA